MISSSFLEMNMSAEGHFGTSSTAVLMQKRRRSSTLDHFEDKIEDVCIETSKEVVNSSRCLAPTNFDFHVKVVAVLPVLVLCIVAL